MSRALTPAQQAEWDACVQADIDAMPPLRPEQISRLSALFDYPPLEVSARELRAGPQLPQESRARECAIA